jgi:hypothetical protein
VFAKASLEVGGDRDGAVLPNVQSFFDSSGLFTDWKWLEPGPAIGAVTSRNFATGGERMMVVARVVPPGQTELEVTSASYPLYDWGRNRRNIQHLVEHLQESGLSVEIGSMISKHTLGGPTEIEFDVAGVPSRVSTTSDGWVELRVGDDTVLLQSAAQELVRVRTKKTWHVRLGEHDIDVVRVSPLLRKSAFTISVDNMVVAEYPGA